MSDLDDILKLSDKCIDQTDVNQMMKYILSISGQDRKNLEEILNKEIKDIEPEIEKLENDIEIKERELNEMKEKLRGMKETIIRIKLKVIYDQI